MMLNCFKVLNDPKRNSAVDVFRALAAIAVLLFHFNSYLRYGYLGVDLFFVISGLLVSDVLTKNIRHEQRINYFRFILSRGLKIWPSYYTYLFAGLILCWILYRHSDPQQIIPLRDLKRYLFFYQNFTSGNYHWSFDHVWSLCIEEHFYLLLPVLFIVVQEFFNRKFYLFLFVGLIIVAGIVFKPLGFYFLNSRYSVNMTPYRIDAFGWGVLLNLLIAYDTAWLKKIAMLLILTGILLFSGGLLMDQSSYFHRVILPSVAPLAFCLMIAGAYYFDFRKLKILRVIAYYSYNLYLWHVIYIKTITATVGNNVFGLIVFLFVSMITAILFTVLVEEKVLAKRKYILSRIFNKKRNFAVNY